MKLSENSYDDFFEPDKSDLRGHAASGFVYSAAAQATRIITQFISVVALARILSPSDFGLVAKINPIYLFALMFHDLGLSQSTIQKKEISHKQVNSFFWINSGIGAGLAAMLIILSPVVGWFYKDERAAVLTAAMSLLIFVSSLGNQHGAIMQRKMEFRAQSTINIISAIGTVAVSISFALLFKSYWALYAGMATGTLVGAAGVWIVVKWRPSSPSLVPETGAMLRHGLGFATGNFIGFLSGNLSGVVMGKTFGDHLLGIYDRSARLLNAPLQQLIWPISGVVVPILYRLHSDPERYRLTFLRTISSITFAVMPGVVWVVVASERFVTTFLGAKWNETVPVFAALSFSTIPILINSSAGWLLTTQGRSKDYARWSLFSAAASIASLLIGLYYGILGVAISGVFCQIMITPLYWLFACKIGPVNFWDVTKCLFPHVTTAALCSILLALFNNYMIGLENIWVIGIGIILSYSISAGILLSFNNTRHMILSNIEFFKYIIASRVNK